MTPAGIPRSKAQTCLLDYVETFLECLQVLAGLPGTMPLAQGFPKNPEGPGLGPKAPRSRTDA